MREVSICLINGSPYLNITMPGGEVVRVAISHGNYARLARMDIENLGNLN